MRQEDMGKRPQQNKGKKKGGKRSRVQRDYDEGLDDDHGDAQEKAPLVAHRGEYANGSAASGLTAATCKARPAAASQDFGNGIQC